MWNCSNLEWTCPRNHCPKSNDHCLCPKEPQSISWICPSYSIEAWLGRIASVGGPRLRMREWLNEDQMNGVFEAWQTWSSPSFESSYSSRLVLRAWAEFGRSEALQQSLLWSFVWYCGSHKAESPRHWRFPEVKVVSGIVCYSWTVIVARVFDEEWKIRLYLEIQLLQWLKWISTTPGNSINRYRDWGLQEKVGFNWAHWRVWSPLKKNSCANTVGKWENHDSGWSIMDIWKGAKSREFSLSVSQSVSASEDFPSLPPTQFLE